MGNHLNHRKEEHEPELHQQQSAGRFFEHLATHTALLVGSAWAFLLAACSVVIWGLVGPYYHYSDTWQLVINTATTILTFLIVFLIHNTQNHDAKAIHLKLDELIRSTKKAHNEMIDIEKLSDSELKQLEARYQQIREECEQRRKQQPAA